MHVTGWCRGVGVDSAGDGHWCSAVEEQSDSDCTVWSGQGAVAGNASTGRRAAGSSGQTEGRDVLKGT